MTLAVEALWRCVAINGLSKLPSASATIGYKPAYREHGMLIAFGGLPGTGKTTVAQALARRLTAVYLRIDTLERAFASVSGQANSGPTGYLAAYAVASDNLCLGLTVVADSVNSLNITRHAWRNVALNAGVQVFEIELICSDVAMHRLRVDGRKGYIPDFQLPTWNSVLERQYDRWESAHLVIDTAIVSAEQAVETVVQTLFLAAR